MQDFLCLALCIRRPCLSAIWEVDLKLARWCTCSAEAEGTVDGILKKKQEASAWWARSVSHCVWLIDRVCNVRHFTKEKQRLVDKCLLQQKLCPYVCMFRKRRKCTWKIISRRMALWRCPVPDTDVDKKNIRAEVMAQEGIDKSPNRSFMSVVLLEKNARAHCHLFKNAHWWADRCVTVGPWCLRPKRRVKTHERGLESWEARNQKLNTTKSVQVEQGQIAKVTTSYVMLRGKEELKEHM